MFATPSRRWAWIRMQSAADFRAPHLLMARGW